MADVRQYDNFSGGINQRLSGWVSESNEYQSFFYADDIENFNVGPEGIEKAKGFTSQLNSALAGKIQGIFEFKGITLVAADGKIYTVSAGVATQVHSGANTSAYWISCEYGGSLILCNGVDAPVKWNGSTVATISMTDPDTIWNSAKPIMATEFRGRLFYIGDATNTDRVYTPASGTDNDFTVANGADAFDVSKGFGGKVIGARAFSSDMLVIYKERCIRRLSGSTPFGSSGDPFAILPITDQVGCLAPRTIVVFDKEHFFLSQRGLMTLSATDRFGDVDVNFPSYLTPTLIKEINFTSAVVYNANAEYIPLENRVYLFVPTGSGTTNTKGIVYDPTTRSTITRSGINASAIAEVNKRLWHGDYSGQVYAHNDVNNYDGSAYDACWKSKIVTHSGAGTYKRYKKLVLVAEGEGQSSFIVRYSVMVDGLEVGQQDTKAIGGGSLWDSFQWDIDLWDGAGQAIQEIKNLGRGRALKIEIYSNSLNDSIKIRQMWLEYEAFSSRKG